MNPGRGWLIGAAALIWLPLVMAGGSLVLTKGVAAPALIAALSLACVVLSLVVLWVGVARLLGRTVKIADLLWLGLYGLGAVLYTQLGHRLSP